MIPDAQNTAQPTGRPDQGRACHVRTPARLTGVLAAFFFALPLVAIVASPGVVPLLLGAALFAGLVVWRSEKRLPRPDGGLTIALGGLLLWCAAASLWSVEPLHSLTLTVRIGVILAAALLLHGIVRTLDGPARRRIGGWLAAGVVLGLGLMVAEIALGFPFVRSLHSTAGTEGDPAVILNRGATALAILCWPAGAVLLQRVGRVSGLALVPALLLVLSFLSSLSAGWGLIAGAAVTLAASAHRSAGRIVLVLATVGAMAGSPLAAKHMYGLGWHEADWLPLSAAHRVAIWNYSVERIAERPLIGWGFDAARYMERLDPKTEPNALSPIALHPHNAPIQILLELGLIGALIALAVALTLIQRAETLPKRERAFAQATYATILAISCSGFGVWQNQWLALMASAALAVALTGHGKPAGSGPPGSGLA